MGGMTNTTSTKYTKNMTLLIAKYLPSSPFQDIEGAVPNPNYTSTYDYINVKDIDGASPKKLMGVTLFLSPLTQYTGHRSDVIKDHLERGVPYHNKKYLDQFSSYRSQYKDTHNEVYVPPPQYSSAMQQLPFEYFFPFNLQCHS